MAKKHGRINPDRSQFEQGGHGKANVKIAQIVERDLIGRMLDLRQIVYPRVKEVR